MDSKTLSDTNSSTAIGPITSGGTAGDPGFTIAPIMPGQYYPISPGVIDYSKAMADLAQAIGPVKFSQFIKPTQVAASKPYESKAQRRITIPVHSKIAGIYGTNADASLEMTTNNEGDYIEFTLLLPGRQAVPFKMHRKEFAVLGGEVTLDGLAK